MQDQFTLTVFAGPVKVRIPFVGQSLIGTVIFTLMVCLGKRVLLSGLKLTPFKPLLLADQFKLRLVEVLVSET